MCLKEIEMNMQDLIAAVRGVMRDREIKRLLPQASHKTEPILQRRNPARAARKGAKP